MLNRLKTPGTFPPGMPTLREEALTINPLYRPPLKNVPLTPARALPRRVQCVCQNEVEKMRRAYCLNPKSFGLMAWAWENNFVCTIEKPGAKSFFRPCLFLLAHKLSETVDSPDDMISLTFVSIFGARNRRFIARHSIRLIHGSGINHYFISFLYLILWGWWSGRLFLLFSSYSLNPPSNQ